MTTIKDRFDDIDKHLRGLDGVSSQFLRSMRELKNEVSDVVNWMVQLENRIAELEKDWTQEEESEK